MSEYKPVGFGLLVIIMFLSYTAGQLRIRIEKLEHRVQVLEQQIQRK